MGETLAGTPEENEIKADYGNQQLSKYMEILSDEQCMTTHANCVINKKDTIINL
jgi:hypothetical protein